MKKPKENKQLQVGKLYKANLDFFNNGSALASVLNGKITYFLMLKINPYEEDYIFSFDILVSNSICRLIAFSTKTIKEVV